MRAYACAYNGELAGEELHRIAAVTSDVPYREMPDGDDSNITSQRAPRHVA